MRASTPRETAPRIDTLVCRLAGGMALLAAAVFFAALIGITRLPLVATGTDAAYAIPGTSHVIEGAIIPVLAWCGGVAAVIGCTVLALGGFARFSGSPIVAVEQPRRHSVRRPTVLLIGGAMALAAVVLLKR